MSERKQGRRSAEAAEQTKHLILRVAADMFCELGYERVSLRNISEKAGVSHSLIRHHFGSKEKIWQAVSDGLDGFMQQYMAQLNREMPVNASSNQKIYLFMVRMLAFALVHPHPVQILADAIRHDDDALLQYFMKSKDRFSEVFGELFGNYNDEYPDAQMDQWESKWQMLLFAHGALSLAPMMKETWPSNANNRDKLLMNHWELFNTMMANQFGVNKEDMIHPEKLEDVVIEICCPVEFLTAQPESDI